MPLAEIIDPAAGPVLHRKQVDRGTLGIRLCLAHPATDDILESALLELRRILESAEAISFV